ncbi:MAG TPA: TolC family protein [Methylophilaceae bacterium]|nr:TolC family protein [Methylophilaceae bacterium]HQC28505.1 TolC family protein [Methylotenera sp.]
MRFSLLLATCVALTLSYTSNAEELIQLQRNQQLTLTEVVRLSILRSPKQAEIQAGKGLVNAKNIQANSFLPSAPAVSAGLQNDAVGSNRNLSQWEVGLDLPIWLPGQKTARTTLAQGAQIELDKTSANLSLDIAGQVRDAVWSLGMAINEAELQDARHKAAQDLLADVEKRWKAGELAKTDVMLAQNGTLLAKAALIKANAEVKHAEHRYWILTGLKELPNTFEEPLNSKEMIDDSHPWLAESAAKIEIANHHRSLSAIEQRENPQVMLNVRHERGAFDSLYNDSVGVAIRVPLDAKVRSAPMMANAEMAIAQAMSEHEQRQRLLESAFHEAQHNLEVIREEIEILQAQHKLSQESLQLAKKSFALGESDLIDLLRIQATAYESERALKSRQTQMQWHIARYNQAIGVLP